MPADLLVIVPTRGRPQSIAAVVEAWTATGAWKDATLAFVTDYDDPQRDAYFAAFNEVPLPDPDERHPVRMVAADVWRPLVPKLNLAANLWAPDHFAVAFMGDDHRPRTPGWAARYIEALRELGTGIVYGNDLIQGAGLPTQWAMTSDIVRALGRMVPAEVEHLYCDNAILDLGREAGCLRYLPDVVIEHCHPIAGRGQWDEGYERVNARTQYAKDRAAYGRWKSEQLVVDAATVRGLKRMPTTI